MTIGRAGLGGESHAFVRSFARSLASAPRTQASSLSLAHALARVSRTKNQPAHPTAARARASDAANLRRSGSHGSPTQRMAPGLYWYREAGCVRALPDVAGRAMRDGVQGETRACPTVSARYGEDGHTRDHLVFLNREIISPRPTGVRLTP